MPKFVHHWDINGAKIQGSYDGTNATVTRNSVVYAGPIVISGLSEMSKLRNARRYMMKTVNELRNL